MKQKKEKVLVLVGLVMGLVLLGCPNPTESNPASSTPPPATYSIGDAGPSGVGTIFYLSEDGLSGLEAAPSGWNGGGAEDPIIQWKTDNTVTSGSSGRVIGTGAANTAATTGDADSRLLHPAAALCWAYEGGGLNDWFLPSRDELAQLHQQRALIDGLGTDDYWSSSTSSGNGAWGQFFNNGSLFTHYKNTTSRVRPIRAF